MRIAFYAPLKPPDHPVPSGDRRLAQLFVEALRRAGHEPVIASRLRSFDGAGDPTRQAALAKRGQQAAAQLVRRWRQRPAAAPRLWFTYHLYYKAPDWLGPAVCDALAIPYVVAEASFAAKRADGAWAQGHRAVAQALRGADAVIGLNPADRAGVLPLVADAGRWLALPPFLDTGAYGPALRDPTAPPRLVAVAMMRPGDKLASYRLLGAALARVGDLPWSLDVIGDGPARPAVTAALMPLGARVRWHGTLDEAAVAGILARADLCVWPAINEAFGMALLEAQASGLPVVAGDSGGVAGIVENGVTGLLVPPGDAEAFAAATRRLIAAPPLHSEMAAAALRKARGQHDLATAAARLARLVAHLTAPAERALERA